MQIFVVDDEELMTMSNIDTLDERVAGFLHLHICVHCGHPRTREDVKVREVSSGILHCPKCDLDGPLNIEVREDPAA